ncbi:cellulase family glycosylhydrolase [Guptibacillus hwajinpoensis]|uniref:cellulase family glycosylhydrolase n=1 Tax=Guptibacillus hwajinpoensis TaxID=208199 RepID=UPI001CFCF892|nr:cellulase family glycosylhydrolase [Pseudalkalibacillus hwajinpoensis]
MNRFKTLKTSEKLMIIIVVIHLIVILVLFLKQEGKTPKEPLRPLPTFSKSIGVSIHPGLTEQDIQKINDAGINIVRIDIFWSSVEKTKGIYDFKGSGYDQLNDLLTKYDIRPYYILAYENPLYERQRSIVTDEGRTGFINFVAATVDRYKGQNIIWEIWNEPNLETFWKPQPSIDEYSTLVKEVSPIIQQKDPTGVIVAPALAGIHEKSMEWLKQLFEENILNYIDAISVHPYRNNHPESALYDYQVLRNLLSDYSDEDIPIISGEWGYSMHQKDNISINEIEQASYLARTFLINYMFEIPISIWYDWKNDGVDKNNKEHNFGLLWYDSTPKLSFLSIQTLSKTLNGFKYIERIHTSNSENYIIKFKNSNGKNIIVFWTTSKNKQDIKIPLKSGNGEVVSMLGAEHRLKWEKEVDLTLTSRPNYLLID